MGALIDLLPTRLPTDLPVELLVGWAAWVLGGLLLMLWFMRRSAPRLRDLAPLPPPTGAARLSGTHAAVRQASGTQTAVRQSSGTHTAARPSSGLHAAAKKPSGLHTAARTVTYGAPTEPPPMDRPAPGVRPPSAARIPDAYTELSALLDSSTDPPRRDR